MWKQKDIILMLLLSLSPLLPGEGLFSFDLILKKKAPVEGAFVCIGEVATVVAPPSEKEHAEKIKRLCLMQTPEKSTRLTAQRVREEIILQSGYDATLPRRILGEAVVIEPVLREVSLSELDGKLHECYAANRRYDQGLYRFFILDENQMAADVRVSPDAVVFSVPRAALYRIECKATNLSAGLKKAKIFLVNLSSKPSHKSSRRLNHRARRKASGSLKYKEISYLVGIRSSRFVAKRQIEKGKRLEKNDFEIIVEYNAEDTRRSRKDLSHVTGMRARRQIRSGEKLKASDLQRVIDVERGSVVELEYHFGPIKVSLRARALQAAGVGEVASFRILKSNRRVRALVASSTRAILEEKP